MARLFRRHGSANPQRRAPARCPFRAIPTRSARHRGGLHPPVPRPMLQGPRALRRDPAPEPLVQSAPARQRTQWRTFHRHSRPGDRFRRERRTVTGAEATVTAKAAGRTSRAPLLSRARTSGSHDRSSAPSARLPRAKTHTRRRPAAWRPTKPRARASPLRALRQTLRSTSCLSSARPVAPRAAPKAGRSRRRPAHRRADPRRRSRPCPPDREE